MRLIHVKASQNHMATTFHFVVSCEQRRESTAMAALYEGQRLVARLETELSEFLPSSPVFKLNHGPTGTRVRFSPRGFHLLRQALFFGELTHGAFNCLAKSRGRAPRLECNADTLEVWATEGGTHLSFGAIGKGYALDQVRGLLALQDFRNFVLSAGGSSVILSGYAYPREPWRWGWSWEREAGEPLGLSFEHCSGRPIAIGISGTQEQGEHILGRSDKRAKSALFAGETAAEADALSTALFVAGWDRQSLFSDPLRREPVLGILESDGTIRWNRCFEALWGPAA
ncbi:MAG: FAD:protein FMN transferase [Bdellovibrionales bacterium]|nr:FAD:protein FMN transferase [Bdellovibrionales bacterium]